MSMTESMAALAAATEREAVGIYDSWREGLLDDAEFVGLAVAALQRARARGAALADVALATTLSTIKGEAVAPLGLTAPDNPLLPAYVMAAAHPETSEQMATLARAEPLDATQEAYSEGMRRHGVPAWTRVLNSGACELCVDLANDVLPGSAEMYHHKGCGCSQRPILN